MVLHIIHNLPNNKKSFYLIILLSKNLIYDLRRLNSMQIVNE